MAELETATTRIASTCLSLRQSVRNFCCQRFGFLFFGGTGRLVTSAKKDCIVFPPPLSVSSERLKGEEREVWLCHLAL